MACLVSDGIEVGIDLEPHGRAEAIAEIAVRVFSPAELAQYEALTGVEKLERALSLWTLKEAYAKARGLGLSLPLEKISFLFGGEEGIRLELDSEIGDDSGRWQFCLLEHAGHRIAVVTERIPALRLQFCEARQVLAEPKRLGSAGVRWFANPAKAR
ncbi:MAG: 4'-phosphopantetheinyl transferase superfamily protein [Terracidiphilus sp.]